MWAIQSNSRVALRRTFVAGTLMFAVLVACDDPVGQSYLSPTLETIWPNEDGWYWEFGIVQRTWDEPAVPIYATPEEVPPITLDDIEAFLEVDTPGSNIAIDAGTYTLRFLGQTPVPGGRLVQNLREELAGPRVERAVAAGSFEDALLARLARARPDLREKIAARFGERKIPASSLQLVAPLVLHGGAWEKTSSEIGTYGDIDDQLAWLYLDANLQPRSEFQFQLVPSLADDVYLLCRILQRTTIDTQIGRLRGALECLYVVDYGITGFVTEDQQTLGYFRLVDYGIVTYVPSVGPVRCLQRWFETPAPLLQDPLARRAGDTWLEILRTGLPAGALSTVEAR